MSYGTRNKSTKFNLFKRANDPGLKIYLQNHETCHYTLLLQQENVVQGSYQFWNLVYRKFDCQISRMLTT